MINFFDKLAVWWYSKKSIPEIIENNMDNVSTITGLEEMLSSQSIKTKDYQRIKNNNNLFHMSDLLEDKQPKIDLDSFEQLSKVLSEREDQIIKDKNKWENTFDSIPDILIIVNKNREMINANKAFYEATNLTSKDIVGKKCYELMFGSDHNCTFFDAKNKKILGTCVCSLFGKSEIVNIDNEYLKGIFLFSVASIQSNDPKENDSIILLRNITKIKEIEQNLIQKENMIDCISKIGNYLMQDMRWKDVISLVLEHVVTILHFDFSFIMQRNLEDSDKLEVADYYSTIPFDCMQINEFLVSPEFKLFEKKSYSLSKSIKDPIFRSDVNKKNKSFHIFDSIDLKGIICIPIKTSELISQKATHYLVLGTKEVPKDGFDEVYVRTCRTISNLLGSFLAKLMIEQSLKEKEIYFTTLINNHILEYAYRFDYKKQIFSYASKNFTKLVNTGSEQIIGMKIDDLFIESKKYLLDLHGIIDKLSIEEQKVHGIFTLINNGEEEKHEQIIRGIFSPSNKLIEIQCVGKRI